MPRAMVGASPPPTEVRVVGGDDPLVHRHVIRALVKHAEDEQKAGRPSPWAPGSVSVLVTEVGADRPLPTTVDSDEQDADPNAVLLTVRDLAAELGISLRTAERIVRSGELPVVRIRSLVRIRRAALDAYLRSHEHTA